MNEVLKWEAAFIFKSEPTVDNLKEDSDEHFWIFLLFYRKSLSEYDGWMNGRSEGVNSDGLGFHL